MDYLMEFIWTILVRIPLICLVSVFTITFLIFTFIILVVGVMLDVFLHVTGLAKE